VVFLIVVAIVLAQPAGAHQDSTSPDSFVGEYTVTLDRVFLLPEPDSPIRELKRLELLLHTVDQAETHTVQDAVAGLYAYRPSANKNGWETVSVHTVIYSHMDCTQNEPVRFEGHAALLPEGADSGRHKPHIPSSVSDLLDDEGIVTDGTSATTPGTVDPIAGRANSVRKQIREALNLDGAFKLPDVFETFPAPGRYFVEKSNEIAWIFYEVNFEYTTLSTPCGAYKAQHRRAAKAEHQRALKHPLKNCSGVPGCKYRTRHGRLTPTTPPPVAGHFGTYHDGTEHNAVCVYLKGPPRQQGDVTLTGPLIVSSAAHPNPAAFTLDARGQALTTFFVDGGGPPPGQPYNYSIRRKQGDGSLKGGETGVVNVPFGGPEAKGPDPPAGSGFSSAPCAAPTQAAVERGATTYWRALGSGIGGVADLSGS
jgi:hypothetical protein